MARMPRLVAPGYRHYIAPVSEDDLATVKLLLDNIPDEAPARTTGPSRSVGTIEPGDRSAVPNSSRTSSNKPAKPWHRNAPAPNHTQPVKYAVPRIVLATEFPDVLPVDLSMIHRGHAWHTASINSEPDSQGHRVNLQ